LLVRLLFVFQIFALEMAFGDAAVRLLRREVLSK
jgi:hypothetical protein